MPQESTILETVKNACGIEQDCEDFDNQLCLYINGTIADIYRLRDFSVDEADVPEITPTSGTTWQDIVSDISIARLVMEYVCSKARMQFDTPVGSMRDAMLDRIDELEFSLTTI